jgi:hypothetical protein
VAYIKNTDFSYTSWPVSRNKFAAYLLWLWGFQHFLAKLEKMGGKLSRNSYSKTPSQVVVVVLVIFQFATDSLLCMIKNEYF